MAKKRFTDENGNEDTYTEVGFREANEPWSNYILDNGRTLRFKNILVAVYESDNLRDNDGNPILHLEGQITTKIGDAP